MGVKSADLRYTTVRRTDRLEQEIVNLQQSMAAMNELLADMRARLLPVPVDLLGRQRQSPVVRNAVGYSYD